MIKDMPTVGSIFKFNNHEPFIIVKIKDGVIISYDEDVGFREECTVQDFIDSLHNQEIECLYHNKNQSAQKAFDEVMSVVLKLKQTKKISSGTVFITNGHYKDEDKNPYIILQDAFKSDDPIYTVSKNKPNKFAYGTKEDFLIDLENKYITIIYSPND